MPHERQVTKEDRIASAGVGPGGRSRVIESPRPVLPSDRVIGVSGQSQVLALPGVTYLPIKVGALRWEQLPAHVDWLLLDVNLAPQVALHEIARLMPKGTSDAP